MNKEETYSTATITEVEGVNLEEIRKETREFIKEHKEAFRRLNNTSTLE